MALLASMAILTGADPAAAVYAEFSMLGGYNDNYRQAPDDSPAKTGSLFLNPSAFATFGHQKSPTDSIYLNLLGDAELYPSPELTTASFIRISPGYRFVSEKWTHDIAYALTRASGFGSNGETSGESAGPVRGKRGNSSSNGSSGQTTTADPSAPQPYLSHELNYLGLYSTSSSLRLGPRARMGITDYMNIEQRDSSVQLGGKMLWAAATNLDLTLEAGYLRTRSNVEGQSYSGPLVAAGLTFRAEEAGALSVSFRHSGRSYAETTRRDSTRTLVIGLERKLDDQMALQAEFSHANNESNISDARYKLNAVAAGVAWELF